MGNFISGIICGIISSFIVSHWYRLKDRERDRTMYFEEVYIFTKKLYFITFKLPDAKFIKEMNEIKMPRRYKWIHIKKKEKNIIDNIEKVYQNLEEIVYHIDEEYRKLEGTDENSDVVCVGMKFSDDIQNHRIVLEKLREEAYYLKHPEARRVLERIKTEKESEEE